MDYNDLNAEPEDNLKPPCCMGVVYVVLILLLITTGLGKLGCKQAQYIIDELDNKHITTEDTVK
ncbi:MAG: hypothetical protein IJS60_02845 [Abditibacteriota bacterium]|nr:hypothetical protein [Abditibacteriota bacterium]